MTHCNAKFMALALLAGSITLAPAAQAAETINRNTGVGALIAAQGNAALRYIEASLKLALPVLPKGHAVKVAAPVVTEGPGGSSAAGVRCAE